MAGTRRVGLGRNVKSSVMAESAVATYVPPAQRSGTGTAASQDGEYRLISYSFTPSQPEVPRRVARPTRSQVELVQQRRSVEWEMVAEVLPRDGSAAGAGNQEAPDYGRFIQAAMGAAPTFDATVDGEKVVYALGDSLSCLSVTHEMGSGNTSAIDSVYMEALVSAWVNEMVIAIPGGAEAPTFTFSGGAIDHLHVGGNIFLEGAHDGSTVALTTFALPPTTSANGDSKFNMQAGMQVAFIQGTGGASPGTLEDNGGAGYTIATVDRTTPQFTTSESMGVNLGTSGIQVVPFIDYDIANTDGTVITDIDGAITLGVGDETVDSGLIIVSASITLNNNVNPFADVAFRETVADFTFGFREVTGEITVIGGRDEFDFFNRRKFPESGDEGQPIAIQMRLGSASGRRLTIDLLNVELMFEGGVDVPDDGGPVQMTIPFMALASDETSADELTLTWESVT